MIHLITLLVHFFGFGTLVTVTLAGFILDRQFRKATDPQARAATLRSLKVIGLLSPIAIIVMLITGIMNMRNLGIGLFDFAWLAYKIVFFAIAVISGILFGIRGRQRGALAQSIASGNAAPDAEMKLKSLNTQISLFHFVMTLLLVIIVSLSIYGKLGGQ